MSAKRSNGSAAPRARATRPPSTTSASITQASRRRRKPPQRRQRLKSRRLDGGARLSEPQRPRTHPALKLPDSFLLKDVMRLRELRSVAAHTTLVNRLHQICLPLFLSLVSALAQTNEPFDGHPWNLSTGNLSVGFIQASPIGAQPRADVFEAPPSAESLRHLKDLGLVADEDYVAWGAVEREPGRWDWKQHDAMEQALHQAGLKYVVYNWVHFPPVWLRDQQKDKRTLMRCLEHDQETHYLSIFDPRTIDWYDHFYKALNEHFGNRIDDVYACILGPYGEGNYPLFTPDWVNMGHCHEGYWCGDEFAIKAFQNAMRRRYLRINRLNRAWSSHYRSFAEIDPPGSAGILPASTGANPRGQDGPGRTGQDAPSPQERRRWLDFIGWYHQAIIDFAEQSLRTVLKYFPPEKVRMKPGGNARGVNPISWGTYCPGYAKMAGAYGIVLQPADCQGAVFGDKWMGTAYQFYHVKECTEPPGDMDEKTFVRRILSDVSCGASQFFTYQFEQHAANTRKYAALLTGKPGETEVAVYCPTTLYRLGGSLDPTIAASARLRGLCDFDVLDELLITDGALTRQRYRAMILFQADTVERAILEKMEAFQRAGGKIIAVGAKEIKDVEGKAWSKAGSLPHVSQVTNGREWLEELSVALAGCKGVEGQLDGLWTTRRGQQLILLNTTDKPIQRRIDSRSVIVPAGGIWSEK
ncbi:MAG: hypothetical protein C5B50_08970 [Verrucomicrobia bacterium]|nr:MAG: hypothetical protein C5B50_08970 [Verrucomicrobiota bacterium]